MLHLELWDKETRLRLQSSINPVYPRTPFSTIRATWGWEGDQSTAQTNIDQGVYKKTSTQDLTASYPVGLDAIYVHHVAHAARVALIGWIVQAKLVAMATAVTGRCHHRHGHPLGEIKKCSSGGVREELLVWTALYWRFLLAVWEQDGKNSKNSQMMFSSPNERRRLLCCTTSLFTSDDECLRCLQQIKTKTDSNTCSTNTNTVRRIQKYCSTESVAETDSEIFKRH